MNKIPKDIMLKKKMKEDNERVRLCQEKKRCLGLKPNVKKKNQDKIKTNVMI